MPCRSLAASVAQVDLVSLSSWIGRDFGLDVARVEPVGLGADARADLARVVTVDGREHAAKTSSGPQPGLAVADLLASRGVVGVPGPLRTRDGALTAACGPSGGGLRLSVVPWVRGHRVLDTGMAPPEWARLGELLGRLHTTPLTEPRLATVPREDHDPTVVVAQARAFADALLRADRDHPADPAVAAVSVLWAQEGPRLLAVADRALHLSDSPRWAQASPVLCHGDPHHGNLLVDGSGGVHLIDWDDAVVAPREADLMFVVGGVFSHATITEEQVRWFFEGYAPVTGVTLEDLNAEVLAYLRCVRALVDVLDLAETALAASDHALADRWEALRYASGTLGAGGLVELALS